MKRGNDNTSRGYNGYHTCWRGRKHYLRSKLEFIVCCWLDMKKIKYSMEDHFYKIGDKLYKPDFFIYNSNKITTIIEVKYSEGDRIKYINQFYDFFKNNEISYKVFSKRHVNKILQKYRFHDEVENWISTSSSIETDFKGKRNPHYGSKHSNKTKKIIGESTKERFGDIKYKNSWMKSLKASMNRDDVKSKISKNMKKRMLDPKERLKISIKNRKYSKIVKSVEKCKNCGKEFCIESYFDEKVVLMGKKYEGKKNYIIGHFCSMRCGVQFDKRSKRDDIKLIHMDVLKEMTESLNRIPKRKEFLEHCKNLGISGDIRRSFGTFKKFIEEVKIG